MDGAGKSTLAKKVYDFLVSRKMNAELLHGHGYSVSEDSFGLKDAQVRSVRFFLKLLLPLAFLDNLFTYYFKYQPRLKIGILICDRYFYDKLARLLYYGVCGKTIARIYLKALPRPDFIFFLDLDPKEAGKRKREYTDEELKHFSEIYKFISEYLRIPVVDTNISLDVSSQKIFQYLKPILK